MSKTTVLLTNKDRNLLLKVSSLLEEIIETLDILEDKDTMKSIKQAEEDIKAGRVRSYKDFLKEPKNRRLQKHTGKTQTRTSAALCLNGIFW